MAKHARNVYAHSEEECKMLLAEMIIEMKAEIVAEKERIKAAPKASDKNTPSTGGEITPVDGFSLSVASYVVKAKVGRSKQQKMCEN